MQNKFSETITSFYPRLLGGKGLFCGFILQGRRPTGRRLETAKEKDPYDPDILSDFCSLPVGHDLYASDKSSDA